MYFKLAVIRRLFVNTSGSGKTRITLEGLCRYWGLYFTCQRHDTMTGARPSFGSTDLPHILYKNLLNFPDFSVQLAPSYHSSGRSWNHEEKSLIDKELSQNWNITERWFKCLLLARFILLEEFLNVAKSLNLVSGTILRRQWLLLQTQSYTILQDDIFHSLTQKLGHSTFGITTIDDALGQCWAEVSRQLKELEPDSSEGHLFIVIDEAQDAAEHLRGAFKSGIDSLASPYEDRQDRPVLRQLVHVLSHTLADQEDRDSTCSGTFIVTGTGISTELLREATSSITYKPITFAEIFRTGGFDRPEGQTEYVSKYLGDFVTTEPGIRLLHRLWKWLQGRYRFTAEFIALFLANNGFQNPQTCLNDYITSFAGLQPSDGTFDEPDTGRTIRTSYVPLNFDRLRKNPEAMHELREHVYRHLLRSINHSILSKEQTELLEYGFARYLTSRKNGASVGEPLVLLAAAVRLNTTTYTLFDHLWSGIQSNESTPPWNGFENILVYYFAKAFAEPRKLEDIFSFYGNDTKLASCRGTLVSLYSDPHSGNLEEYKVQMFNSRNTLESSIHLPGTLGENAVTYDSCLKWLRNGSSSAFCFPPQAMGPDILFVLKLEGHTRLNT
ncbi:hypothetical protein K435DRAFT_153141 [Dendrothele bispora CBS 962.96]|uniref:Uncharacterized protein n=1 Tax=Dendrothele bispora (strain CBS 962.96) TaxID=1314807 RepID=A0A4S8KLU9_DENBC|nr:hypothetical protein K435DRAFT_153141 [Dendrothele bispora CBS 962.96]